VATAPIRLIASDIDGTLLNPQFQVSPVDRDALIRAREAGIEVVLVTGRRHAFAMPIARQLGFDLCLISSNGAVTRSTAGETYHRSLIPREICRQLCTGMSAFRGDTILSFDKEGKGAIVLERLDELEISLRRWIEKNTEFIEIFVPIEKSLTEDPVQAMFCGTVARMQEALAVLPVVGLEGQVTISRTEYRERNLSMIDVVSKTSSKGLALERWTRHLGIPRAQVMAIGDNYNDVEMLEFAGYPVIMENACEELHQRGWRVTASNAKGGVAAAVELALATR